jgi:hypothetical protein
MNNLTEDQDAKSNVDWLTEVIHRYSELYIHSMAFDNIKMNEPIVRTAKVGAISFVINSSSIIFG